MAQPSAFLLSTVDRGLALDIMPACMNLSRLLADQNGVISKAMATRISSYLKLLSPGIVVYNTTLDPSMMPPSPVPMDVPIPEVSIKAFNIYNAILTSDPTYVGDFLNSPLDRIADLINLLPPALETALTAIYLDSYAVYLELISATAKTGLATITQNDLSRLDSNIRWFSSMLEINLDMYSLDFLESLRYLQRTIAHVRYMDYLFVGSYQNKLDDLNSLLGGV